MIIIACTWQNRQNDLCTQSWVLDIHRVWSESSLSAWKRFGSLATHKVHSEDWSDWADAQADGSLRWAHRWFCWVCRAVVLLFSCIPWLILTSFIFSVLAAKRFEVYTRSKAAQKIIRACQSKESDKGICIKKSKPILFMEYCDCKHS